MYVEVVSFRLKASILFGVLSFLFFFCKKRRDVGCVLSFALLFLVALSSSSFFLLSLSLLSGDVRRELQHWLILRQYDFLTLARFLEKTACGKNGSLRIF